MNPAQDGLDHVPHTDRGNATLSHGWPSIRRIAVLRALFLGDLLCAVPAIRALHRRFPQAQIDLIGLSWADTLVHRLPYLNELLSFPGYPGIREVPYDAARTAAFLAEHAGAYDLVVQLHGDGRASNGFVAALNARYSAGYRRDGDERLDVSAPYPLAEHEIRRWLRLVSLLGAQVDDTTLEFPLAPHQRRAAAVLLDPLPTGAGPLIGIHTGASDEARRWPAERFAALAARLVHTHNASIVLTGNAEERELCGSIAAQIPGTVLDLAERTELGVFGAVIERLDLLISNDTGAAHMAVATQTPSVVLFGPGRASEWGPLDYTRHRVVDAAQTYDRDGHAALQRLPLEPVWYAIQQSLAVEARHA